MAAGRDRIPAGLASRLLLLAEARAGEIAAIRPALLEHAATEQADRALSVARAGLGETGARPGVITLGSSEGLPADLLHMIAARLIAAGWPAEVGE